MFLTIMQMLFCLMLTQFAFICVMHFGLNISNDSKNRCLVVIALISCNFNKIVRVQFHRENRTVSKIPLVSVVHIFFSDRKPSGNNCFQTLPQNSYSLQLTWNLKKMSKSHKKCCIYAVLLCENEDSIKSPFIALLQT